MQEYQYRVQAEKVELDEKLDRLKSFIDDSGFSALDAAEQDRLRRQAEIMAAYSGVLAERMGAWTDTDD